MMVRSSQDITTARRTPLRLGVVVQGPLFSSGRTLRDVRKRDFVCKPEIEQAYTQSEELGIEFVLVTWTNEDVTLLPEIPENFIKRISFPKLSFPFIFLNNWNKNNKYKQYYSTLIGLNDLKARGVTHVIKVRTDSYLDLSGFQHYLLNRAPHEFNLIMTPALNIEKPDLFMDYYFSGATEVLENFLKIMLNKKELYSNVHFDTFYKYVRYAKFLTLIDLSKVLYRGEKTRPNKYKQNMIKHVWKDLFTPGPRNLYETYRWRGEIFGTNHTDDLLVFSDNLKQENRVLTEATIERLLDESFQTMESKEKFELFSMLTFFLSSYFEDYLNRISAVNYLLIRRLRTKFKHISKSFKID